MPLAQLITAAQLQQRLHRPDLLILDCRFALDDPAYGQRSYAEGHIPGAQFADLERDLSGPVHKGVTGRHPLPNADQLQQRLRDWGLNRHSEVVLYDDGPGAFAARAWWLLAWPRDTGAAGDPGLLSAASDCLGSGGVGCDDHALREVVVADGEVREGLDINDWYYDPQAMPPPMEPRGETLQ